MKLAVRTLPQVTLGPQACRLRMWYISSLIEQHIRCLIVKSIFYIRCSYYYIPKKATNVKPEHSATNLWMNITHEHVMRECGSNIWKLKIGWLRVDLDWGWQVENSFPGALHSFVGWWRSPRTLIMNTLGAVFVWAALPCRIWRKSWN